MIKILHTADLHANYDFNKFIISFHEIRERVGTGEIDLVVIPGDIGDSRMFADKNYMKIMNMVADLSEYCPILIIYGTPSHDYKGSLDCLPTMSRVYPIMVVEDIEYQPRFFIKYKEKRDFQIDKTLVSPDTRTSFVEINKEEGNEIIMFHCLPWPMKYRLFEDDEMKLPPVDQGKLYTKKMKSWLKYCKQKTEEYKIPTFLVAHLQLQGSIQLKDQDISSENHDPADYFNIADYGLLGHIHKHQKIKNLYYSGSIYNKTWNELEDKYFNIWTVDGDKISVEEVLIDTPKKVKIECTLEEYRKFKSNFEEGVFDEFNQGILNFYSHYELWWVISLPKKQQLDIEKEIEYWTDGTNFVSCKIDLNTLKVELSERAKNFDIKTSLDEKFKNWCTFKGLKPTDFQIDKIKELEND